MEKTWTEEELAALPRTAEEARFVGSRWYYTGKPCTHRHKAPRRVGNGQCVQCARAAAVGVAKDRNYYECRELGNRVIGLNLVPRPVQTSLEQRVGR